MLSMGSNLPGWIARLERRTRDDLLHPLRPPSLLAVEAPDHTRYRKSVSAVFTPRAVAGLRDRVEQTAVGLLDQLADESGVVDIVARYCSQLPVAIISDILGVPDQDRRRVREFGELAAPSLDIGLPWRQYRSVQKGIAGFNSWLADHLRELRRNPSDSLMSSADPEVRKRLCRNISQRSRASGDRRVGVGRRLRNHGEPVEQWDSNVARHS